MAEQSKTYQFSDTNIQIEVQRPGNFTGNGQYISQFAWDNGNAPATSSKSAVYGKFMNCMEIDWGNAKIINDFDPSSEYSDLMSSLTNNGIKTSDQLLRAIWFLMKTWTDAPTPNPTVFIPSDISRPKSNTVNSINWTGGSVSPSSINSGSTGTFNPGNVIATYTNTNGTSSISFTNFTNTPTVNSSNTAIISVGTPNLDTNTCVLTGKATGSATITVKDGDTIIKEQLVQVVNATSTNSVSATYTQYNGSTSLGTITGTSVTAPNVNANTTITTPRVGRVSRVLERQRRASLQLRR